jgi:hypothetical protein
MNELWSFPGSVMLGGPPVLDETVICYDLLCWARWWRRSVGEEAIEGS